jgi:hypothetical protein
MTPDGVICKSLTAIPIHRYKQTDIHTYRRTNRQRIQPYSHTDTHTQTVMHADEQTYRQT